jgi:hypothetical protein
VAGAQFEAGTAQGVEWSPAARAVRSLQVAGHVVPELITKPALRDAGEVDVAQRSAEPAPEVIGLQEAGRLGVGPGV